MNRDRREFLANVGKGMLLASVGSGAATQLGLTPSLAAMDPQPLLFGDREPLVGLMQDTPANKLMPLLIEKLKGGTTLQELVAAGALANTRRFCGHDYEGHHCFAALMPSLHMARELPEERCALPVLKVLYRNTDLIQQEGARKNEIQHAVEPAILPKDHPAGDLLRQASLKGDVPGSERIMAALCQNSIRDAYNQLASCIPNGIDVHRVVACWRSWETIDAVGKDQAAIVLRQAIHWCQGLSQEEKDKVIRAVLPKLMEQHKLLDRALGTRKGEDAWVDRLAMTIYGGTPTQAAEAAAAALGEGIAPEAVGEAISLACNRLTLCDAGRIKKHSSRWAPEGSVHGNSVGVHATDATNAWRNIARVTDARNTFASLIVAAYQTTIRPEQHGPQNEEPLPLPEHLKKLEVKDAVAILKDAEAAIKANDQPGAAALVHRYGELKLPERPVFDLMLRYAVSEDGSLHAEKYYRTACEEFATTRPAFRWRHLVALARVTASEYGHPSPGYMEATRLLKL